MYAENFIELENEIITKADKAIAEFRDTEAEKEEELVGIVKLRKDLFVGCSGVSEIHVITDQGSKDIVTNVPASYWEQLLVFKKLRIRYIPSKMKRGAAKILSVSLETQIGEEEDALLHVVEMLSDKEQRVIKRRLGLDGDAPRTLE